MFYIIVLYWSSIFIYDFRHLSTRQKRLVDFIEVKTDWIDENSRRWLIQDHSRASRETIPIPNRVSFPNLFPNNNSSGFQDQSIKKPATILVPNSYSDQEVVSMLSAQARVQINLLSDQHVSIYLAHFRT